MAIDDKLQKSLEYLDKELETDIPKKLLTGVISKVPYVGDDINRLLFGDGQKRVNERAREVFEAVAERMKEIDESQVNRDFFKSDEFLTILLLAIEQLQTTHDKQKLEMLASAIANSGTVRFSKDSRKELFIRILRDLAPEHVVLLNEMHVKRHPRGNIYTDYEMRNPSGNVLAILQALVAHGLVEEHQEKNRPSVSLGAYSSESEVRRTIENLLMEVPDRCFKVSALGVDFLSFFGTSPSFESNRK